MCVLTLSTNACLVARVERDGLLEKLDFLFFSSFLQPADICQLAIDEIIYRSFLSEISIDNFCFLKATLLYTLTGLCFGIVMMEMAPAASL